MRAELPALRADSAAISRSELFLHNAGAVQLLKTLTLRPGPCFPRPEDEREVLRIFLREHGEYESVLKEVNIWTGAEADDLRGAFEQTTGTLG